eukprot:GEZU01026111.1.p1 GENE.GEZU01026111.1~~GEZU01026111.1.p1  ORF type:complete len:579 (-),score=149.98 GEZU01026111.1:8-1744(-)
MDNSLFGGGSASSSANSSSTSSPAVGLSSASTSGSATPASVPPYTIVAATASKPPATASTMVARGAPPSTPTFYRNDVYDLVAENELLKKKIDAINRENRDLKKALYELNVRFSALYNRTKESYNSSDETTAASRQQYFDIDKFTKKPAEQSSAAATTLSSPVLGGGNVGGTSAAAGEQTPIFMTTAVSPVRKSSKNTARQYTVNNKLQDRFVDKFELTGHEGAVYIVKFSPNGRFVASGSFDKTLRIWDMEAVGLQSSSVDRDDDDDNDTVDSGSSKSESRKQQLLAKKQTDAERKAQYCFRDHVLSVACVSWANNSESILSGSFDHTIKLWDINSGNLVATFSETTNPGFIQTVEFNPEDQTMFYSGDSKHNLCIFDIRQAKLADKIVNNAMVNTLYVHRVDGNYLLTGDSRGQIKTWDIRKMGCVDTKEIDPSRPVPISHVHINPVRADADDGGRRQLEGRYLAVNSYDNIIRLYDRGAVNPTVNVVKPGSFHLYQQFKGHKNKNWPIKSSFFYGRDYDKHLEKRRKNMDTMEFGEDHQKPSSPATPRSYVVVATYLRTHCSGQLTPRFCFVISI